MEGFSRVCGAFLEGWGHFCGVKGLGSSPGLGDLWTRGTPENPRSLSSPRAEKYVPFHILGGLGVFFGGVWGVFFGGKVLGSGQGLGG